MKFRQIARLPDYLIYEDGRIFSVKRRRFLLWQKSSLSSGRYHVVGVGGRKERVHVLVAEAFIGPKPSPKSLCLHRDDNRYNNHWRNLYWGTNVDNGKDAIRNGRSVSGMRNGWAKLTDQDVRSIRLLSKTETNANIAAKFRISDGHVSELINRKKWRHLA